MEQVCKNSASIAQINRISMLDELKEKQVDSLEILCPQTQQVSSFDIERLGASLSWASHNVGVIDQQGIIQEVMKNIFNGISSGEIAEALILAVTVFVERDPVYGYVAARLLLKKLFKEVTGASVMSAEFEFLYRQSFVNGVMLGVQEGIFDARMLEFDLEYLAHHLKLDCDNLFDYMGLRTLFERYFVKYNNRRIELPQSFWMRVAMGVCYNEPNKNERAVEFYNAMAKFRYIPGTPTLLHSALMRPQLSSCYLTTVEDDLKHIFKCYSDNAQLSKWSGGVANDWTNIRACGAEIESIKVDSQGVVPFLKIVNDITAAINRSGKRRSATCVYLETWHLEIEDFIDLRKNTGDERRRTHDINTANWIPDLFIKRVIADADWTLFSPDEVPDLHGLYGKAFELRYHEYEEMARQGKIKLYKTVSARALWRKMLSRLFESGHPWITFKDPSNIRSPQDHAGVVNSSNLCTEILLNTSADETAVCNLGSVNLAMHVVNGELDITMLATTISSAVRMLDNVIDINFYPTIEAKNANMRHRPIGLGVMGFQDALYKLHINFSDERARTFADESMELISYYAILTSSQLAQERGAYESYKGSKWDRNIFPQDTIDLLEKERGMPIDLLRTGKLDWEPVRQHVRMYGMRNSNTMAIAPTATISNIVGCFPCIEPIYKNLYVKSNMTGEFTVVNKYLVADLKQLGLWDDHMLDLLKYYDGSVQMIDSIPHYLKAKYQEAFEIDPIWLLRITASRGQWIDQSQSHNVFLKGVSGKLLNDIYIAAWQMGLKTTYYLRSLGASQIEKSTLDAKKFGFTQKRQYAKVDGNAEDAVVEERNTEEATVNIAATISVATSTSDTVTEFFAACSISADPDCEVCQ